MITENSYDPTSTALLVIDPYSDFLSEGGKLWPRITAVAEANGCVQHMQDRLRSATPFVEPYNIFALSVAPARLELLRRSDWGLVATSLEDLSGLEQEHSRRAR